MALSQHGKLVAAVPVAVVLMLLCAGAVESTCTSEQVWCNGHYCANLQTDVSNCGACGTTCSARPDASTKCNAGHCEYTCNLGFKDYNGTCINVQTDVNNCGACGTKCAALPNASTKCNAGHCEYTCNPGFKIYRGKCIDVQSDVNNCGACGTKCDALPNVSTKCKAGHCEYTCNPGFKDCDGKWKNGCECVTHSDTNNCGKCRYSCPQPKYYGGEARCTKGQCENSCKSGMTYNRGKRACEKNGNNGNNGGYHGGNNGGNNGGNHGGNYGGNNGGNYGGNNGGNGGY